ncbi:MAG: ATP-binding protein [Desulfovibrio sp.]|mgnify:CR=1 FL=1|nr:MAG: ATP-binding protein [Desulfovibrio sp.]
MTSFVLHTHADPGPSRKLARAAMSILGETVADKDVLYNFDLALSEACANVVRHAYEGMDQGDLEITVTIHHPDFVTLEVADWGPGFPTMPQDVKNAQPEAEGGRGLFIMSELADSFSTRKQDGKHIVSITINIGASQWIPYE